MNDISFSDSPDLKQKRVAVLSTDGFEQSELLNPVDVLESVGATVDIITPDGEPIRGWDDKDWGQIISADLSLTEASPEEYDALLLPGGVINADSLRTDGKAQAFAEHFFEADKPVFAICHGAQLLIDAGLVEGRKMTSYHAIATDLENAGAEWIDAEVVTDGVFVTSRKPDDLPAFCKAICETLAGAVVS